MHSQPADGKLGSPLFAALIALVVLVLASAARAADPGDLSSYGIPWAMIPAKGFHVETYFTDDGQEPRLIKLWNPAGFGSELSARWSKQVHGEAVWLDSENLNIVTMRQGSYRPPTVYASLKRSVPEESYAVPYLLAAHNRERKTRGIEPLHTDHRLNKAAQTHAEHCASRNRLSHYGPGGNTWSDRARAAGYNADLFSCSENIAYGYVNSADVTGGWMRSPGHRHNVLGRWYHAGFGCAKAANGRLYWCAVYCNPASIVPQRPRPLLPINPLPRWPRR